MNNNRGTREDINAAVDDILDEDEEDDFEETVLPPEETPDETSIETPRRCKCAVENSLRFSLRVMEVMRLLQREEDRPSTSTAEDIVDYIKANYRSDGDVYSQVRTALRQLCAQGFVVELLNNEYHLIGPSANRASQDTCPHDCETRESLQFPRDNGPSDRDSRSPYEELLDNTFVVERPTGATVGAASSEMVNADYCGPILNSRHYLTTCQDLSDHDDLERRHEVGTRENARRDEQREEIVGPSRPIARTSTYPVRSAKKTRLNGQGLQRVEERDEETTTEEELECVCDDEHVEHVNRHAYERDRRADRARVVDRDRRNERARDDDDPDEENEDTEDSAYGELRERSPKRSEIRERELRSWIRRCRKECVRRRPR